MITYKWFARLFYNQSIINIKVTSILLCFININILAGVERLSSRHPYVWSDAAVNAVILEYTYTGSQSRLTSTADRLTLLMHRNILYSIIKYNSVGAVQISMVGDEKYDNPDVIFKKILGNEPGARSVIKEGHSLVFVWGHIYEDRDEIFVQTYIRFLRRGVNEETISFSLSNNSNKQFELVGKMPFQAFAFAPIRLTVQDLDIIDSEFEKNILVRKEPDINTPGYPMGYGQSFSYRILEARGEWMKIQEFGEDGGQGWIRTGVNFLEKDLRYHMPELYFIEAAAGYLRYQMELDKSVYNNVWPKWIQRAINQYEDNKLVKSADIPAAVAKVMSANLILQSNSKPTIDNINNAYELYSKAVELIPYNADTQNLRNSTQAWKFTLLNEIPNDMQSNLANDFANTLSLDPGNYQLIANLETVYSYLLSKQDYYKFDAGNNFAERLAAVKKVREAIKTQHK